MSVPAEGAEVRSSWPVSALLALGVAACGGTEDPRREEPREEATGGWAALVRELVVGSDYGQIYV
jgi:hypothetical protein